MDQQVKRNKKYITPIIIAVSIIAGMFIGRVLTPQSPAIPKNFYGTRPSKIDAILSYIEQQYVDSVSKQDLIEKTLPAVFENLDPHSSYIPAENFQEIDDPLQGEFEGIGVQFNIQKDTVVIVQVISGGPSERVNLKAGDRIVTVNDSVIAGNGIKSRQVVKLLKGPKGTKVTVGVKRHNIAQLLQFEIKRDKIPFYSIDVSFLPKPGVGYLKISRFAATTYDEFISHTSKLLEQGMTELIIDLRGNGGGFLNAATNIANEFLSDGQAIVYTEGRAEPKKYYNANDDGICKHIGVTVLLDEGSASASEILAGALQDNDRGTVIGRRSFGKGLVMEQQPFADGSAIRLTVSRYYTPTGRCIQKPYENGHEDYFREIEHRYLHGEFQEIDSIQFPDSLKYTTPNGKIVYGGGGIMPDIFVPLDTTEITDYFSAITAKGLIYDFCFDYTDKNRETLNTLKVPENFIEYVENKGLLNTFIAFADSKGVSAKDEEIKQSSQLLKTNISAYLARNILDDKGFYPIWLNEDKTYNTALGQITKTK